MASGHLTGTIRLLLFLLTLSLAGCANDDPVSRPDATGACCAGDATCAVRTEPDCAALPGSYRGDDSVCDPDPCAALTGACCLPGGACELRSRSGCEEDAGVFSGIETPCASVPCPEEPRGFVPPEIPTLDGVGDPEVQAFVSEHVQSTSVLLDYAGVLPADPRWLPSAGRTPCWEHADTAGACTRTFDVCHEDPYYEWIGSADGVCDDQPVEEAIFLRATTSFDLREATLEYLDVDGNISVTLRWEPIAPPGMEYTLYNGPLGDGIVLAQLELSADDEERQVAWEVPRSVRWTANVAPGARDRASRVEATRTRHAPDAVRSGPGAFHFFIWSKPAAAFRIHSEIVWDGAGHGRITTYSGDGGVVSDREW